MLRAAFPISITHPLGTVVIPAEPKRIVTLGLSDADAVFALGSVPVAMQGNTYTESGVSPWLEGIFDPAKTEILKGEPISIE